MIIFIPISILLSPDGTVISGIEKVALAIILVPPLFRRVAEMMKQDNEKKGESIRTGAIVNDGDRLLRRADWRYHVRSRIIV